MDRQRRETLPLKRDVFGLDLRTGCIILGIIYFLMGPMILDRILGAFLLILILTDARMSDYDLWLMGMQLKILMDITFMIIKPIFLMESRDKPEGRRTLLSIMGDVLLFELKRSLIILSEFYLFWCVYSYQRRLYQRAPMSNFELWLIFIQIKIILDVLLAFLRPFVIFERLVNATLVQLAAFLTFHIVMSIFSIALEVYLFLVVNSYMILRVRPD